MYKIKSAFATRENDFSFGKFNEVNLGERHYVDKYRRTLIWGANIDEC